MRCNPTSVLLSAVDFTPPFQPFVNSPCLAKAAANSLMGNHIPLSPLSSASLHMAVLWIQPMTATWFLEMQQQPWKVSFGIHLKVKQLDLDSLGLRTLFRMTSVSRGLKTRMITYWITNGRRPRGWRFVQTSASEFPWFPLFAWHVWLCRISLSSWSAFYCSLLSSLNLWSSSSIPAMFAPPSPVHSVQDPEQVWLLSFLPSSRLLWFASFLHMWTMSFLAKSKIRNRHDQSWHWARWNEEDHYNHCKPWWKSHRWRNSWGASWKTCCCALLVPSINRIPLLVNVMEPPGSIRVWKVVFPGNWSKHPFYTCKQHYLRIQVTFTLQIVSM